VADFALDLAFLGVEVLDQLVADFEIGEIPGGDKRAFAAELDFLAAWCGAQWRKLPPPEPPAR
jgi:hypothetical protein